MMNMGTVKQTTSFVSSILYIVSFSGSKVEDERTMKGELMQARQSVNSMKLSEKYHGKILISTSG